MTATAWREQPLGDLCDDGGGIIRTGPFGSQLHQSDYSTDGTPVVMPKDLVAGRISTDGIARVSREHVERLKQHKLHVGDIVYGRRGDIGRCALVTPREAGWLCGTGCLRIHLGEEELVPCFLFYFLTQPTVINWIYNQAVGATMPNLNTGILRSVPVRYPDEPTQRRIASILSAYNDLIEKNTRRIAILEQMARRLYGEWFVHFRFPGHEGVRMVESKIGEVPEGWDVKPLGELVDTQYGYTETAQEEPVGPKFLRGMDINKQPHIDWSAVPHCPIDDDRFHRFRLDVGDIVVIRMADPGKVGIVEREVTAVFASYLVRLKITSEQLDPYFLFYFLTSDRYQGYITGASTGTTRKSASAPVITGIDIVLPPRELRGNFNKHVSSLRQLLNHLLEKNTNLRTQRDLLLPKLISGEIDVSDFPDRSSEAAE